MNIEEMAEEFLICPKCRNNLIYKIFKEKEILICKTCRAYYPVEDEIPMLLIEDAVSIEDADLNLNDLD